MPKDEQQSELFSGALPLRPEVVKHSFDQTVTRLARLAGYGQLGESLELHSEVSTKQAFLALDDFIVLSISIRRLLEATELKNNAQNIFVPTIRISKVENKYESKIIGTKSFWTTINKIIHSSSIRIVNYSFEKLKFENEVDYIRSVMNRENFKITPVAEISPTQGRIFSIHVFGFVESADKLLDPIIDKCAEHCLFLEADYR